MSNHQETARAAVNVLASLWCGLIIGVSFIATPVKFTAPLIDFKEALDLGRVTFGLFGPIELVLSFLLLVAAMVSAAPRWTSLLPLLAAFCLMLTLSENLWLRPLLDERLLAILADRPVAQSDLHLIYVAFQALKLPLLLAMALTARKRVGRRAGGRFETSARVRARRSLTEGVWPGPSAC